MGGIVVFKYRVCKRIGMFAKLWIVYLLMEREDRDLSICRFCGGLCEYADFTVHGYVII